MAIPTRPSAISNPHASVNQAPSNPRISPYGTHESTHNVTPSRMRMVSTRAPSGAVPDPDVVAVGVGERELAHAPWLVLHGRHGQSGRGEAGVQFVDGVDDHVATGAVLRGIEIVDLIQVEHAL